MSTMQDLKYIETAYEMAAEALIDNDEKRARSCILAIQNYLNATRHPLAYFSIAMLLKGSQS